MRDIELYEGILGLRAPWVVEEVKLDIGSKSVEVRVGYEEGSTGEGERGVGYDRVERRWRHLDTCGFKTTIVCRVPRVRKVGGKVETLAVPWAGKRSRFTLLYERFAVEVLLASRSVSAAAKLLGLSWDQFAGAFLRADFGKRCLLVLQD